MAITEAQRSALYESMKAVHGAEVTETIMSIYPSGDGDKIATTRDLAELQAVTRAEMAELRTDLRTEMAELRTEMAELRSDVRTDIAELRADLHTGLATMRSDLMRTFGTWLFASQAGVVAAVALVSTLLR